MNTTISKLVKNIGVCVLFLLSCFATNAQESKKDKKESKPKNYRLSGYVKDLRACFLFGGLDDLTLENRIHNRLNFKWYPNDKITFAADLRTQLIYGEFPKFFNQVLEDYAPIIDLINSDPNTPNFPTSYGEVLEPIQNFMDLSVTPIDKKSVVLFSYLDRFWIDWYSNKWQVRLGRQRINWGRNWVWNPNDVFNTYSFIDFDYEERPGADAAKIVFYPNYTSELELVFAPGKIGNGSEQFKQESIIGSRFGWNKWNYDFQAIAALYKEELAIGGGWAGNIKDAGLKGEFTYFIPFDSDSTAQGLVASLGMDYSFQNGLLLQGEVLFNQFGSAENQSVFANGLGGQPQGPKNLWTHKWAIFATTSYPITPLLQGSLSIIFNPSDQSFYAIPGLNWSLSQNLDFYFIAQITEKQTLDFPINKDFYGLLNARFKWSF